MGRFSVIYGPKGISGLVIPNLLPYILGPGVTYEFRVFQGKSDLLKSLPSRLKGYRSWIPNDWRIIVVVDADDDKCLLLKTELDAAAEHAGFITKTAAKARGSQSFEVLLRIACEELEAWFFGDIPAVVAAYPRVPQTLAAKSKYRDPDAISGTWEALERVLKQAGYQKGGLEKVRAAREISVHMDPDRNNSHSFNQFRDGVRAIVNSTAVR